MYHILCWNWKMEAVWTKSRNGSIVCTSKYDSASDLSLYSYCGVLWWSCAKNFSGCRCALKLSGDKCWSHLTVVLFEESQSCWSWLSSIEQLFNFPTNCMHQYA